MKKTLLAVLMIPALAVLAADTPSPQTTTAKPKPKAASKGPKATITMQSGGKIELEFFPDVAPKHVDNFITLSAKGFYDGLNFHRVEPGFVVQGGDPAGNGSGGPGYTVPAEFNDKPHLRGTLAMARSSDPNSAGSQFYICLGDARFLDKNYTVFGRVTKGMDVVDKIKVGDKMKSVKIKK